MRDKDEIQKQIDLLKLQRQAIPAFSHFGDNNRRNIDDQLGVLESALVKNELSIEDARDGADDDGCSQATSDAYCWVLEEYDEPLVEEDDLWVKKALAANKKR